MTYVDGYVIAVPNANRAAYADKAREVAALFKANGATRIVENWADDVPEGKVTSFSMAVKREPDESVVFSWIMWPSKAVRDTGWPKVMADPFMTSPDNVALFDGRRMIFGGFETILDA